MKFLDSNVLAYAFYNNEHTVKCQNAIKEGGMLDTFNLAEAFFIIEKETGSRETAQKSIKSLLKSNIQIIEVDVNIIFEALRNINRHKISIFDMIHYCCAAMNGCDSIISYDKDFNMSEIAKAHALGLQSKASQRFPSMLKNTPRAKARGRVFDKLEIVREEP